MRGWKCTASWVLCLLASLADVASGRLESASVILLGTGFSSDGSPPGVKLIEGHWIAPGERPSDALGWSVSASGNYSDASHHSSFFGQLRIETDASIADPLQGYAAGYIEGYLTAKRIEQHYANMEAWWSQKDDDILGNVTLWLEQQDAFAMSLIAGFDGDSEGPQEEYTTRLAVVMRQLDGLADGYSVAAAAQNLRDLSRRQLHLHNSVGDLLDLFNKAASPIPWMEMSAPQVMSTISNAGHCSALIKVTPDLSDILMAHSSWFIYNSMLRIYKHYTLRVRVGSMTSASFSSYPGVLSSLDDFYLHDTGLVLLQTTNSVFNPELYRSTHSASLLAWQRVRMANMGATGAEWASTLAVHNSGTYNNQYMVIDLNRFVRGKELLPGLLTVVEQIPGEGGKGVVSRDMTNVLLMGYWPSFNVPYFHSIYNRSGYPELFQSISSRGAEFESAAEGLSYQTAPRGKIFRRDAGAVADLSSLKRIMRSNGFPYDPLSGGSPYGAICSRGDLDKDSPRPVGCYDTKVTNLDMAWRLEAEAVNGPTTQDDLPVFSWSKFPGEARAGMPNTWDFDFELQSPLTGGDSSVLARTVRDSGRDAVHQPAPIGSMTGDGEAPGIELAKPMGRVGGPLARTAHGVAQ